jgi:hypothetical protein
VTDGSHLAFGGDGQDHPASNDEPSEVQARDRYRAALAELVRLKDGPRDDAYRAAKDAAWQAARDALGA